MLSKYPASHGMMGAVNRPSFYVDFLSGSAIPGRGGVVPTFSRSGTNATVADQDAAIRYPLANEIRFNGLRRVQNLLPNTGFLGGFVPTGWSRLSSGGSETLVDSLYYPGHKAIKFDCSNAREILGTTIAVVAGHTYAFSVMVEAVSGSFVDWSCLCVNAGGVMGANLGFQTLYAVAGKRMTGVVVVCNTSGNITFRLGIGTGALETGGGSITLSAPQLEDVTGQVYPVAGEYVPVGTGGPYLGNELINNGTFAANVSGWTTDNSSLTWASPGNATLTNTAAANGYAYQIIPTVVGQRYILWGQLATGTAPLPRLFAGSTLHGAEYSTAITGGATNGTLVFTATTTTTYIEFATNSVVNGQACTIMLATAKFGLYAGANVDGVRYLPNYCGNVFDQNFLLQSSNLLDATWGVIAAKNVVASSAVCPDGSRTAFTISDNSTVNFEGTAQSITVPLDQMTRTVSIYVLKTYGYLSPVFGLNISYSGGTVVAGTWRLNTDTGSMVSNVAKVTSVGIWWRMELTIANNGTNNTLTVSIYPATNFYNTSGDSVAATGSVTVFGVMVNEGYMAGAYVPTTSAAAQRFTMTEQTGPALPASPSTQGFLCEAALTNICLQSETLDNATWTKGNCSVTANTIVAPNGTTTCDVIVEDATAGVGHAVAQAMTLAANSTVTATAYVKRSVGSRNVMLRFTVAANDVGAKFNLGTGAFNSSFVAGDASFISASITPAANGFWRISMACIPSVATANPSFTIALLDAAFTIVYNGDGTSSVAAWGADIKAANVDGLINSYVPTVAASVTRSADSGIQYLTAGWYNANAGTAYGEWYQPTNTVAASKVAVDFSNGTSNERILLFTNNPTDNLFLVTAGGITQAVLTAAISAGGIVKECGMYQLNDFESYANNVAGGTDVSGTLPTIDRVLIGCENGGSQLGHVIRKFFYEPVRVQSGTGRGFTV